MNLLDRGRRLVFLYMVPMLLGAPSGVSSLVGGVTAEYTIDEVAGTVDLRVTGLYSHVIRCDAGWDIVSRTGASTPLSGRMIRYSWSYARFELEATEQVGGMVSSTLLDCDEPVLVPTGVAVAEWNEATATTGPARGACALEGGVQVERLAPLANTVEVHLVVPAAVDALCMSAGGSTEHSLLIDGPAAFAGHVEASVPLADGRVAVRTCEMILGVCWSPVPDAAVVPIADVCSDEVPPCDLGATCATRELMGLLPAVGRWRCGMAVGEGAVP